MRLHFGNVVSGLPVYVSYCKYNKGQMQMLINVVENNMLGDVSSVVNSSQHLVFENSVCVGGGTSGLNLTLICSWGCQSYPVNGILYLYNFVNVPAF